MDILDWLEAVAQAQDMAAGGKPQVERIERTAAREIVKLRAELAKCRRVVAAARAVVSNPMWQGGICDEECELEAAVNALAEKENAKP